MENGAKHDQSIAADPSGLSLGLRTNRALLDEYAESRDPGLRDELARRYLPFARSLALRYRGASEPPDDLIQVASVGLVNAIDRYDPERGTPFNAYAAPTILGELKRHFRDRVWTVRVPRGLHDRIADVDAATTLLTTELQRSPTISEVARHCGMNEMDVLEVVEAGHNRRPMSLDAPGGSSEDPDGSTPADWIGSEDTGFELIDGRVALEEAIPHLDERERLVLRLRFVEDMTQSEIAERIGHSQMHVSRILRRTLQRMREHIDGAEVLEEGPA